MSVDVAAVPRPLTEADKKKIDKNGSSLKIDFNIKLKNKLKYRQIESKGLRQEREARERQIMRMMGRKRDERAERVQQRRGLSLR